MKGRVLLSTHNGPILWAWFCSELLYIVSGKAKCTLESSLLVSYKVKPTLISNLLIAFCPRNENICSHKNLYMNVCRGFIHNCQNLGITQMSLNWWMVKQIVTFIRSSAIKQKELLIYPMTWMILKDLMLSERSQTQKATYDMVPFTWCCRKGKTVRNYRDGGHISACQGWVRQRVDYKGAPSGNFLVW